MPRLVSPPLEELSTLRTPLNHGEQKVLKFFLTHLPPEWEIYIQPHLNGLRPDFVLLNPNVGIAVFEVKSWNLNSMNYRVEFSSGKPILWATNTQGEDFMMRDNPIPQIVRYKDNIVNLYCPGIGTQVTASNYQPLSVVTAGVIMTESTTRECQQLFAPFREHLNILAAKEKYYPLVGKDALERGDLYQVLPAARWNHSKYMTPELADELRHWLIEPDCAKLQRQPLELNKRQKDLIRTRTNSGYRRIKGAAGSGKSLVLAGRAAQLSSEGKEVLVLSYNITLWHYLKDLAVRHNISNKKINTITWLHFHQWCKNVCLDAGYTSEYDQLWKEKSLKDILEVDMVELVNSIVARGDNINTYDAILVDEGQDYNLDWWSTLRRFLRPNGEMVLVADETQDLYQQAKYWTDSSLENAGFKGNWLRLETCHRTPPSLIPYLQQFGETYLPKTKINLPQADSQELDVWPVQMRWIQQNNCSGDRLAEICAEEVLKMPTLAGKDTISYSDIVLLVANHNIGINCVNHLENKGVKTAHVFGQEHKSKKPKKMGFFMGAPMVKSSTIHSFKGWESSCLVIGINEISSNYPETYLTAIYVALSRLKRRMPVSYITVVCSEPMLAVFGKTWPTDNSSCYYSMNKAIA